MYSNRFCLLPPLRENLVRFFLRGAGGGCIHPHENAERTLASLTEHALYALYDV